MVDLTSKVTANLDTLEEGNTDPDVVGALESFKSALNSVNEAIQTGNRDGFNEGMSALNAAAEQFTAQQGKLLTGSLQGG